MKDVSLHLQIFLVGFLSDACVWRIDAGESTAIPAGLLLLAIASTVVNYKLR
jgi:hypothetical protein